ncbi:MAG: hypothetical protein AAF934_11260 [Bacteroidota bacterium]
MKNDKKKEVSKLAKRFLSAMKHLNYSGYRLAEEMDGFTTSAYTHIRSGRNNPSMKIVIAFLQKFPEINARWLLTGEGRMYNEKKPDTATKTQSDKQLLQEIPIQEIQEVKARNKQPKTSDTNDFLNVHLKIFLEEQINERLNTLEGKIEHLTSVVNSIKEY